MNGSDNLNAKNRLSKRWLQAIAVIIVLALGFWGSKALIGSAPKAEKRSPQKQARLVQDQELQPTSTQITVKGFGLVKAEQQVQLQPQITGLVQSLGRNFIPGDFVQKGDTLITIDPRDYELNLENAKANLANAQATLAKEKGDQVVAQADFEMLDIDVSKNEKALILRQPQVKAAQAALTSAKAEVSRAQLNLERTQIKAPFDGIVTDRQASIGMLASPSSVLGSLVKSEFFWVEVSLPQQQLKWINLPSQNQEGSLVCAKDAAFESNVCNPGRVLSLQRQVESQGRQAKVLVQLEAGQKNSEAPLLLSQYVEVEFKGPTLNNVFVLNPSVVHGDTVWLNEQNALRIQPITIIYRSENKVIVSEGLEPGQKVITSNLGSAVDGMAIRTAAGEN